MDAEDVQPEHPPMLGGPVKVGQPVAEGEGGLDEPPLGVVDVETEGDVRGRE